MTFGSSSYDISKMPLILYKDPFRVQSNTSFNKTNLEWNVHSFNYFLHEDNDENLGTM